MNDGPWYDAFFRGRWLKDQLQGLPAERTAGEADVILKLLEPPAGGRVLDVPCGEGRHAIELGSRGFRTTGVDFNAPAVDAARERARARGVAADFVTEDMRRLAFDAEFDAAYCVFGSFGYFDDDGDLAFARAVRRALKPGARFLVDTHVMESLLPVFKERDWSWGAGQKTRHLQERRLDLDTGRIEAEFTWIAGGVEETSRVSIRLYPYRELAALLRAAGFATCRGFDETGAPFRVGSRRLHAVAE